MRLMAPPLPAASQPSKSNDHRALLQVDLVAQFAQLDLPPGNFADVGLAVERLRVRSIVSSIRAPLAPERFHGRAQVGVLRDRLRRFAAGRRVVAEALSMAAMMVSKTFLRACHLEVASTMVQGANSDSVSSSISSMATRYSSYFLCRAQSASVTRHASSGSSCDRLEPLLLLLLADVEEELQDDGAVVGQHAFELDDVAIGLPPRLLGDGLLRRAPPARGRTSCDRRSPSRRGWAPSARSATATAAAARRCAGR